MLGRGEDVVSGPGNGAVTCRRGGGGRGTGTLLLLSLLLLLLPVLLVVGAVVVEDKLGIGELQEEKYVPIDPHAARAADRGEGFVVLDGEGQESWITPGLECAERNDDDDDDEEGSAAVK